MIRTLAVAFIGVFLASCSSPEEREAKACSDKTMAFVMSQNFVKERLRSPSTAEFPNMNDLGVSLSHIGPGCRHSVIAYVDAQNGFGGTVRSRYSAILEKEKGKDIWRLETISIE